ncbi:hypothetical protein M422DRAFT_263761 [Sphaerobolus stellatus SS14]|uniref:Uncharacterized protein n=1 Tax=Sphaerobolus stellatus (strain SS14) TaxID=990650 RepID=A0A0C9UY75_SPHS4|nr:hypothetical protein M422DRAFT_263761 [Sphaerobolus stellatus SS14]
MALRTLQADLKDFRAYDAKHPKTDFRSWMQMKADGFDTRSGWRLADTCYAHDYYLGSSAGKCMDVIRISDNQQVTIKKVWKTYSPLESEIE